MRGLFVVIGVVTLVHAVHADEPDVELAKAHYRTGEIYYERSMFPEAAHEFEEAYRLSHRPELLYNMGKSYDGQRDHARALTAYRRFLAQVTVSPDRSTVEHRIAVLATLVGRLKITASVDGAAVRVDGEPAGATPLADALEVNPGGHVVEVAHEGFATWRASSVVPPGGETAVSAQLVSLVKVIRVEVKERLPVYKRWYVWTAVAAAAVVASAITVGVLEGRGADTPSGAWAQLPGVRLPGGN
jgi:hypothetical protein